MRPNVITLSAAGVSAPIPLDYQKVPFNVGLMIDFTAGTGVGTVDIEYSFDDPFATYATNYNTNATWQKAPAALIGATANKDGGLTYPVRAVRMNCTAYTSGSFKLTALQGTA